MKIIAFGEQHRRDCRIDVECEGCKNQRLNISAYDDRNYWDNVLPDMKCQKCGESTNSLGLNKEDIPTKYPEGYQV